VFLDESGFLMAPWRRRTWSPKGQPPVLTQRTRSHQKVSAVAALCVSPYRDRVHLFFRLHPDANIQAALVVDFLGQLGRHLRGPIVLIWDRLLPHRARRVQRFLQGRPAIHAFFLPPYAPELNPVELVWAYLKTNPLANLAAHDLDILTEVARRHSRSLQRKEHLLRSFLKHAPLSLRLD
jgi:transposase